MAEIVSANIFAVNIAEIVSLNLWHAGYLAAPRVVSWLGAIAGLGAAALDHDHEGLMALSRH
jgi:hypothetical protein